MKSFDDIMSIQWEYFIWGKVYELNFTTLQLLIIRWTLYYVRHNEKLSLIWVANCGVEYAEVFHYEVVMRRGWFKALVGWAVGFIEAIEAAKWYERFTKKIN